MDKVTKYEQCILHILEKYAANPLADAPNVEKQIIADTKRKHYQLVTIGWRNDEFIHGCLFHFDIKDGKIWLQQNWTDILIGDDLEELGVPKSDIVLGFQHPSMRIYSDYALG